MEDMGEASIIQVYILNELQLSIWRYFGVISGLKIIKNISGLPELQ